MYTDFLLGIIYNFFLEKNQGQLHTQFIKYRCLTYIILVLNFDYVSLTLYCPCKFNMHSHMQEDISQENVQ